MQAIFANVIRIHYPALADHPAQPPEEDEDTVEALRLEYDYRSVDMILEALGAASDTCKAAIANAADNDDAEVGRLIMSQARFYCEERVADELKRREEASKGDRGYDVS